MIRRSIVDRVIALILVISILLMSVGCSNSPTPPTISDANPQTITEIYLQEIVLAEEKISELLLEEETITEVMCCKTIYVPQEQVRL